MLKKINWKKGYGEVIGYTIAVLFLIGFFSQIVGIYMYARCGHTLNDAVMNIGRSLVTEESIDDAQAKAKKGLEKYYASGSKKEWTKGNFITVSIVAHIKSNCFITPKVTTVSSMVMIEH